MIKRLIKLTLKPGLAGAMLVAGLAGGFWFAVNLSEEDRRRIKKAAFELKELPRRVLV
jgi:hypothetical protein